MYCDAEYGQSAPLRLMHAVLLYGSERAIRLAMVHQPVADPQGGPPVLDAGQPLTREFLETLVRGLGQELPAALLPSNILVYSSPLISWWEPPRIRSMFFAPDCDGKSLDGKLFPVVRYGIELDAYRAEEASKTLDHVIQGSCFDIHCPVESYSVAYINPPYDDWAGDDRPGERARPRLRNRRRP